MSTSVVIVRHASRVMVVGVSPSSTTTAADETARHVRARQVRGWLVWGGVAIVVLLSVLAVVAWRLPAWAPLWVARWSPSLDHAMMSLANEDTQGECIDILLQRSWEWEGGMAARIRQRVEARLPTDDIGPDTYFFMELCVGQQAESDAEERLSSARATAVIAQLRARSHDDLVATGLRLAAHAEDWVRSEGITGLGLLKDPRAVPVLVRALDDRDHAVSAIAASSLAEIGDPSVIPQIIRALRERPHSDHLSYVEAVETLARPVPEVHLIAVLGVESSQAREWAMARLEKRRTSDSLPALVRLTQAPRRSTAERARDLLRKSVTQEEIPLLVRFLRHDDPLLQGGSLALLSELGDPHAVPLLLDSLATAPGVTDPRVEQAVLACLPAHHDGPLYEGLTHADPTVRAWVAGRIARRGLVGAQEALLPHADDPAVPVRVAILRGLGTLRGAAAAPLVRRRLTAETVDERVAAIRASGDLGDTAALPDLLPFLGSGQPRERQACVQALSQLAARGDVAVLARVRPLLADREPAVQEAARATLEHLSDDPQEVRELEQRRLDEFRQPAAVPVAP